jgi:hypothetical protein
MEVNAELPPHQSLRDSFPSRGSLKSCSLITKALCYNCRIFPKGEDAEMKNLEEWSKCHNALERTEKLFWRCFGLYEAEEPEEFSEVFPLGKSNVKIKYEKIVHEVMLPDYVQEFISVYLNILVDDHNVGWFKNIFFPDGTDADEFFVIE